MTKTRAVIFDMDGVLIDSEPLWKEAEKLTFRTVGIELTTEMCNLTMGYRTDEVVRYWYERHPWSNRSLKEVETEMIDHVMDFVSIEGKAMPGVHNCLEFFKRNGYQIGLASSSFMRLIQHTVQVLKIDDYFDCIHSAEFETYGKPHPAVYLHAAKQLNCPPEACLAIEDSFNGLLAAKSAKMKTIAVPDPSYSKMERFVIADWVVPSLEVLSDEQALVQFLESSI